MSNALIDRLGMKRFILAGMVLTIAGTGMLPTSKDMTLVFVARVVQGIGFGSSLTAASTYIAAICHPDRLLEGIPQSRGTNIPVALIAIPGAGS